MSAGLRERLAAQIAQTGPLTIAQYMTACLHDPQDGYYATRPALGEDGDFITAPLVSQMFGELIGVWAISAWQAIGAPARVVLAEMGPGDGTLMSDLLRAARAAPAFLDAAQVWLVET
ncbi:MAG TPA: SAM-dependent methyltransferase, partial [Phenylobacterium sp.]|nr:SAM-dependent methyltransferase [Phenylobacterium sp.]